MQYMEYDPFARQMVNHNYTVRSVYIDTPRLLFYHEKLDGIKVRKKLRVRVYNDLEPNSLAFLEIKRKIEDTIFKERLKLPLAETIHLMNGVDIRLQDGYATFTEAATLEKFKYLTKRLNLKPTVLVTYEREALVGIDDPSLRVTFDLNVRSYPNPQVEEIYREDDLAFPPDSVLSASKLGAMVAGARGLRIAAVSLCTGNPCCAESSLFCCWLAVVCWNSCPCNWSGADRIICHG